MATRTPFKNLSFQDPPGQAADAKEKALNQLRLSLQPDKNVVDQRNAAGAQSEGVRTKKAVAKKEAAEAAAMAKANARAKVAAPFPNEAEKKATRIARYAARQARI